MMKMLLERLCRDYGIDRGACLEVKTGSGGTHLYFDIGFEDAACLRGSLPKELKAAYPGIDIKRHKGLVVAPGSPHKSGNFYEVVRWKESAAELSEGLIELLQRPPITVSSDGAEFVANLTGDELSTLLGLLDVENYRDNEEWFKLGMSCVNAAGNEGKDAFLDWSASDSAYHVEDDRLVERIDSFRIKGGVTYRTLRKELIDAGHGSHPLVEKLREPDEAMNDFDGDDDVDLGNCGEDSSADFIDRLNEQYAFVAKAGIAEWVTDPSVGENGREVLRFFSPAEFKDFTRNLPKVEKVKPDGKRTAVAQAPEWLESPRRRTYKGHHFDPRNDHPGWLNEWRGLPYAGDGPSYDYPMFRELLLDVICEGSERYRDYVWKWMANAVQRPWEPGQVAVVCRGLKGTGKGTLGWVLVKLFGNASMQVASRDAVMGRFNSHLEKTVMLFCDEAVQTNDKEAQARMKSLITDEDGSYEAKGKDMKTGKNRLHVYMSTNEDYAAPMTTDERRWFVTTASEARMQQGEWFVALKRQMLDGGLRALTGDLLTEDLSGWDPQRDCPVTEAMTEQVAGNLDPVQRYVLWMLAEGEYPWLEGGPVIKDEVREHYHTFCVGHLGMRDPYQLVHLPRNLRKHLTPWLASSQFIKALKKVEDDEEAERLGRAVGDRVAAYRMPSLEEARSKLDWVKRLA